MPVSHACHLCQMRWAAPSLAPESPAWTCPCCRCRSRWWDLASALGTEAQNEVGTGSWTLYEGQEFARQQWKETLPSAGAAGTVASFLSCFSEHWRNRTEACLYFTSPLPSLLPCPFQILQEDHVYFLHFELDLTPCSGGFDCNENKASMNTRRCRHTS